MGSVVVGILAGALALAGALNGAWTGKPAKPPGKRDIETKDLRASIAHLFPAAGAPGELALPPWIAEKPWKFCTDPEGHARNISTGFPTYPWIILDVFDAITNGTNSTLRAGPDASERSEAMALYNVPMLEAWADSKPNQAPSLQARATNAFQVQTAKLTQQIDAVVKEFGEGFDAPIDGEPSASSVNATAKDLMQRFRDTFKVHPGTFKLVPDPEKTFMLLCP